MGGRRGLWAGVTAGTFGACVIVACVGDDPDTGATPPTTDAASDQTVTPTVDAGDAGTDLDAGDPDARCSANAKFSAPELVPGINTPADETAARLTPDEKTVVFRCPSGDGGTDTDICTATRTDPTATFGAVTRVDPGSVSTSSWEGFPFISEDSLTLLFARSAAGDPLGDWTIMAATRTLPTGPFTTPTPLPGDVNINRRDGGVTGLQYSPYLVNEGSALYFIANGGGFFTYRAPRGTVGKYEPSLPLQELVAEGNTDGVVVTANERTLYYSAGPSKLDIRMATRPSVNVAFGDFSIVDELSSATHDTPTWVSPDGCVLYFASKRNGSFDIFRAQRGK